MTLLDTPVAVVDLDRLDPGRRVRIVPDHARVVVNLADALVGARDGREPRSVPAEGRRSR